MRALAIVSRLGAIFSDVTKVYNVLHVAIVSERGEIEIISSEKASVRVLAEMRKASASARTTSTAPRTEDVGTIHSKVHTAQSTSKSAPSTGEMNEASATVPGASTTSTTTASSRTSTGVHEIRTRKLLIMFVHRRE